MCAALCACYNVVSSSYLWLLSVSLTSAYSDPCFNIAGKNKDSAIYISFPGSIMFGFLNVGKGTRWWTKSGLLWEHPQRGVWGPTPSLAGPFIIAIHRISVTAPPSRAFFSRWFFADFCVPVLRFCMQRFFRRFACMKLQSWCRCSCAYFHTETFACRIFILQILPALVDFHNFDKHIYLRFPVKQTWTI